MNAYYVSIQVSTDLLSVPLNIVLCEFRLYLI